MTQRTERTINAALTLAIIGQLIARIITAFYYN